MLARAKIAALDPARDIGQRLRIQSGEKWDVAKFVWCYHNRQYTTARPRFVRYNAGLIVRSGEESRFFMQRTFSIFMLAALLAGCAVPQVANSPTATTASAPTAVPTPTAAPAPTDVLVPTAVPSPTAVPAPTAAPSITPAPTAAEPRNSARRLSLFLFCSSLFRLGLSLLLSISGFRLSTLSLLLQLLSMLFNKVGVIRAHIELSFGNLNVQLPVIRPHLFGKLGVSLIDLAV
jgi:hypothetical protein